MSEYTLLNMCNLDKYSDDDISLLLSKAKYARDNIKFDADKYQCDRATTAKYRRKYFALLNKKSIKEDATFTEQYKINCIIHSKKNSCYNCRSEYFQIKKREVIKVNELKVTCLCKVCKEVKVFNIKFA